MWDFFSLPYTHNKDKKWDILLNKSIFNWDYIKHHVKSLQKDSKAVKYMVQNLTWSGVYMRSNFLSALLHKVLKLVLLTSTGTKVYVTTMTTVCYDSYNYLMENLNSTCYDRSEERRNM